MTQTELSMPTQDGYPENFWAWLRKNEHIYDAFKKRALRMLMRGRKRYGAKTIVEVLRYESDLEDSEKEFKISNNYTSGMARLFMSEYGHLNPNFFKLRGSLGYDERQQAG